MWALARAWGLTSSEFWALTQREFFLLWKVQDEQREENRYLAGKICATIANAKRDPKVRPQPFVPADFVPLRGAHRSDEPPTEEQLAAKINAAMRSLGGK